MLDLLIAHGADINAKSAWEMGGFGILENATPEQMPALIERGAKVDVWSAAKFDMADRLRAFLTSDPSLVNAKGGDGKRPLHYAASVEIAQILLDHGAEIDALDDDHQFDAGAISRQRAARRRPIPAARGARSDLLLAAALGDLDRVRRHLDEDPGAIRMRVSQDWFPMIDTAKNGGHIYQWTLGFYVSAFDVARKHGHQAVLDLLLAAGRPARSPARRAVERRCSPRPTRSSRHRPGWSNRRRPMPRGWSPTPPATTRPPPSKPCSRAAFR